MIETNKLRNIAFVGHGGGGKTSIAEAMLYNTDNISRLGRTEDGNTAMDFEPEEIIRQSSISTGFHQYSWKKHTVCLIDTPGDQNFFSDTKLSMQAADGAVVTIDAVDGVRFQAEQAWDFADDFKIPRIIFINKLDKERSDFIRTFKDITDIFTPKPMIVQLPMGKEESFKGIVDLISMKAYTYADDGKAKECDIPADIQDMVDAERETLVENIAEADDDLLEKYLEGESLSDDELRSALKKGVIEQKIVPVLCGSATKNIGIDLLSDFIVVCLPSPFDRDKIIATDSSGKNEVECNYDPEEPFAGFVFKTVADPYAGRLTIFKVVSGTLEESGNFFNVNKNSKERYTQLYTIVGKKQIPAKNAGPGSIVAVAKLKDTTTGDTLCDGSRKIKFQTTEPLNTSISFAVQAKNKGDEDKIFISLNKILEEDAGLKLDRNSETHEILLAGSGQVHIETAVEKLKRKYNVEVLLNTPKIPYKETIKKKIRVQGRHKKQTGGHGQFGDCWITMEPLPKGKGFEFVNAIVGGSIPKTYIPAVEKGILEASQRGILAKFPCVDFKVTLDDGSFHAVDSSEMAFKLAGSLAFRNGIKDAKPTILEPIMRVTIITPDEFMGDIMGDLNGRRGKVLGMDTKGKNQVIKAQVPMAEFLTYSPDLRSMTGGRGVFTTEFDHYEEVPAPLSEKIIEEKNKETE
ncbi:MAG TPA: elongation factor G [Desulfobacteraceae bacterium]|nr:elongation factor G [Desulfobacteraceae bacterium]